MTTKPSPQDILTSPLITIKVGPRAKTLIAHKAVLTQVAFFEACLSSEYVECQTNTINLPEDICEIVVQVVHYLYTGKLQPSSLVRPTDASGVEVPNKEPDNAQMKRFDPAIGRLFADYMMAYTTADKLGIESLCKLITDWFVDIEIATMAFVRGLGEEELLNTNLSRLLLARIAWHMRVVGGWEEYLKNVDKSLDEEIKQCPELGTLLMKALAASKDEPRANGLFDKCRWHCHNTTPKCSS